MHTAGDTWAEVTEGAAFAGGIWERGRRIFRADLAKTLQILAAGRDPARA